MFGSELIPLNQMPGTMSEIRALHLSKYEGRQDILARRIPLLDCLWNDVVQLLPLHPRKIFDLQVGMGLIPEVPQYKFFKIDTHLLDPGKTVVYFKDAPGEENVTVKWLQDTDFDELQDIPAATVAYYRSLQGTGELPFNYQFVPHILYMDTIDISDVDQIIL